MPGSTPVELAPLILNPAALNFFSASALTLFLFLNRPLVSQPFLLATNLSPALVSTVHLVQRHLDLIPRILFHFPHIHPHTVVAQRRIPPNPIDKMGGFKKEASRRVRDGTEKGGVNFKIKG